MLVEFSENRNLREFDDNDHSDFLEFCASHTYEVGLYSFPHQGSHFFLAAKRSPENDDSTNVNCPALMAFASLEGNKKFFHVPDGTINELPFFPLGSANLNSIFTAMESATPIDEDDYDLTSNTCAHFAVGLARSIGFDKTPELANFIVDNLLRDGGFLQVAQGSIWTGGLRVLLSLTEDGGIEAFTKELVASQLDMIWSA